jgi:hypothetical protein
MRSRAGYWIGGGLIVAGIAGAAIWLVSSLIDLSHEVDDFQRVPVPGEATMQLEARKYVVYYEAAGVGEVVPSFQLVIANAQTGAPLTIERYGGSLTYSFFGRDGSAQGTVTPERAGAYVVRTDSVAPAFGANVALGRSIASPLLRLILITFAIGGLLVGSGVTLVVVTAVRRSRARSAGPAVHPH